MTIHEPRSAAYAWRCERPGCPGCGAGYACDRAAAAAERHHIHQAHPTRKAGV